jgi:hypothetical protein
MVTDGTAYCRSKSIYSQGCDEVGSVYRSRLIARSHVLFLGTLIAYSRTLVLYSSRLPILLFVKFTALPTHATEQSTSTNGPMWHIDGYSKRREFFVCPKCETVSTQCREGGISGEAVASAPKPSHLRLMLPCLTRNWQSERALVNVVGDAGRVSRHCSSAVLLQRALNVLRQLNE